jgi:hypothetical protein
MFGAVIVPPDRFGGVEQLHNTAIHEIIPLEEIEERFQEFHASELYCGAGPFAGIEEAKRFFAIKILLAAIPKLNLTYIYAAIDRNKLKTSPMGSANPLDIAFRICLLGVEDWARSTHPQPPGVMTFPVEDIFLFVIDDTDDRELKKQLRTSYRSLRAVHSITFLDSRLLYAHDDMYFSDSRDSVGIQIADLCNYFMWRRLVNKDGGEEFYDIFVDHAICAKPEPEWSTYHDLFRTHNSVSKATR